jgi:subtilisin family serine protease
VGFDSDVIAGVDWVAANHESPAVANMSLGGDFSRALNDAVTALSNAGVFIAVAAGNDDEDACGASPASAAAAFTVAASERGDAKSSFSNWGTCVDAYAPGATVKSAWLLGAAMTFSGTSMASPHVAGTAALYKATFGDAPSSTVADWITSNATAGVITGNPDGTPNLLLYKSDL